MKKVIGLLIVILSVLGIADASYLTWQKLSGYVPPCAAAFQCETVLNSKWSTIGELPVSALGVIFYCIFLIWGALYVCEIGWVTFGGFRLSLNTILRWWGMLGLMCSIYFIVVMGMVLNAWCFYCLLSAINCAILFVLTQSVSKVSKEQLYES